ncbi:hypothetical protein AD947_08730 [Acetobacter tropicalis]|uniref:Spore coat protein CotH n=1 Tax=Acetobacter tropicalis TaxID=104102 RepID=A0A149TVS2_9PROT|nr:CotH kinase family protein [Acetobacter tropicalis]KXV57315.1 hypothetical protein AD947_08730 [Acetobacter tropicalis]
MSDILDNTIWALNSTQTSVQIPRPSGQLRMILTGDLPASSSDTTSVKCALMQGENMLFRCAADISWQGQSSMADPKHNFKLKLKTETTEDKFSVKLGSWVPTNKIDLKAYGQGPNKNYGNSDRSMVRDTTAGKVWRAIRRASSFPDNMIAPLHAWAYDQVNDNGLRSGALFSTEGFPCALYFGSDFYGLYTFRSTAPNEDYLIDEKNPMHYLLQPQHIHGTGANSWYQFDSSGWAISSPKLKGYDDQDDISKKFPKQFAVINRLFTYFGNVYSGADTLANAEQYINVSSWIDYILFCEVVGSNDAFMNNVMLASWDATSTSGLWHLCAYDLDETFGILFGNTGTSTLNTPEGMGFVSNVNRFTNGIFYDLNQFFAQVIRFRYASLRKIGVISETSLFQMVFETTHLMDPDDVETDNTMWGTNDQAKIGYILNWINRRISWLDQQWGYSG